MGAWSDCMRDQWGRGSDWKPDPPSAKAGNWRKAKNADLYSIFCTPDPPPPNTRNGGRGQNSREKRMFLAFWSANWRKGVRFPPNELAACPPLHPPPPPH